MLLSPGLQLFAVADPHSIMRMHSVACRTHPNQRHLESCEHKQHTFPLFKHSSRRMPACVPPSVTYEAYAALSSQHRDNLALLSHRRQRSHSHMLRHRQYLYKEHVHPQAHTTRVASYLMGSSDVDIRSPCRCNAVTQAECMRG